MSSGNAKIPQGAVEVNKPQSPSPRDPRDIPALKWLTAERRWCCWSWEWKRDKAKWDKPPRQSDGAFAKNNVPSTWGGFAECWRRVMAGQADGIGFMLMGLPGDRLAAI